MNFRKKMLNPFVLAGQGFVAGAVLFWSTQPAQADLPQPTTTAAVQQIAGI